MMKKYGFGKIVYMDNNNNVICKKTKNHNTNYASSILRYNIDIMEEYVTT